MQHWSRLCRKAFVVCDKGWGDVCLGTFTSGWWLCLYVAAAAYVLILSGTAQHNGDRVIELNVADSRTIFYTQSVYRCHPDIHVVCEVRHAARGC